jgi:hypothetical protein
VILLLLYLYYTNKQQTKNKKTNLTEAAVEGAGGLIKLREQTLSIFLPLEPFL